jgi:hypothetical protein
MVVMGKKRFFLKSLLMVMVLALATVQFSCNDDDDDSQNQESATLEGTWEFVGGEYEGVYDTEEAGLSRTEFALISGNNYRITVYDYDDEEKVWEKEESWNSIVTDSTFQDNEGDLVKYSFKSGHLIATYASYIDEETGKEVSNYDEYRRL